MPNAPLERPVVPSVLDRLIDSERHLRQDPSTTRAASIRELKASLQRDLEWLLNTRRIAVELPKGAEELKCSLYTYGLPEFRELTPGTAGDLLGIHIRSTLEVFEPRLTNIRVIARPYEGVDRIARFVIDAILQIQPMPERVTFDTVLELTSGEYRIRGDQGA